MHLAVINWIYLILIFALVCRVLILDARLLDIKHRLGLRDRDSFSTITRSIDILLTIEKHLDSKSA
jgi:hypothetical protein